MMDGKLIQEKKAFLFDFDGVVADSEPYAFNILKRLMKDHFDVVVDDEDVSITIGNSTAGTARNMERKYGVSLSYDDFVRFLMDYPDYYTEYEGIKPFTDLPELFDMLKKSGRIIGIVSSTIYAHLSIALQRMGLDQYPSFIISGDSVIKHKPDPEPYLMAIDKTGLDPDDVIAIEDSPIGIQAAKNAGISVIAFKGSEIQQDTSLADYDIDSYSSLISVLKQTM